MTDQHEAEPSADPAATAATATADGTGAPAPGQPRGRLTGSAIIQAVTEGHSAVIIDPGRLRRPGDRRGADRGE